MPKRSSQSQDYGSFSAFTKRPRVVKSVARGPLRRPKRTKGKAFDKAVKAVMLKSVEPKTVEFSIYGATVGQLNGNSSGHHKADIVYPDRGTGTDQRIGNRVTATGLYLGMSAWAEQVLTSSITLKTRVVKMEDTDAVGNFLIGQYIESNQAITDATVASLGAGSYVAYDNTCLRNPLFKDSYETLAEFTTVIPERSISGGTPSAVQNELFVPLKGLELEFNGTSGDPTNVGLIIITTASCGNKSLSTASTWAGVAITGSATGAHCNYNSKLYFKDL